ncbi:glucoamylase family protein [Terricaulis silvestris]|uniref:Glycoamylase-like domain-containing protein n=1 Tax=Terricaulis silvestris TaxID=2686094 RepID=A0A6I6MN73_9CAUL|nr:glucoamylase family protein [Terricaulis silvestris]QGZ94788.1 hypothetical protein DSM104635_01619 [Terricaulis silvestris]
MLRRTFALGAGALLTLPGCTGASPLIAPDAPVDSDDAFIVELQERTFRWFWEQTPNDTGLTPDRWPTPSFCSIAAVGFALTSWGIGVERGWVTRAQALERTLNTLRFFRNARQGDAASGVIGHRGFFYHFLDARAGTRFERTELSSIDTTLLLGGMLFAGAYFDGDSADEREVRLLADEIYARVEWTWMRPRAPLVSMGWHPENGGAFIAYDWDQYNEAALLYVLALGSPTHALPDRAWEAWTARFERQWGVHWGQEHLHFPPTLAAHYSPTWIDFRGIQDAYMRGKGIDYFENNRRAAYAQQAYAIANPGGFRDYGARIFGLTACDGPGDFVLEVDGRRREFFSYSARGPGDRDDGTLSPWAVGGSIPFAPEITIPALKEIRNRYGEGVYTRYGFLDSFNPTLTDTSVRLQHGRIVPNVGWVDGDYLGIDQGPIVCMIENWRSGLIWNVMRRSPHIRRGLERAGFTGGWLAG